MLKYTGIGPSPSGKATGFGPVIRRFESCRPSQIRETKKSACARFLLGNLAVLNAIQVRAVGARPAGFEPGSSNARFSLAKTTAHCLYPAGPAI